MLKGVCLSVTKPCEVLQYVLTTQGGSTTMQNKVKVVGVTTGVMEVNHRFEGIDGKYITALETEVIYTSANNVSNTIKVILFKDTIFETKLNQKGKFVEIDGALHTFNKDSWGKRITEVFLSPRFIREVSPRRRQQNVIELTGTICGEINLKRRTTGKAVAEGKLKVSKNNGFSYIPIVAFGNEAISLNAMKEGQEVSLKGRIHSRTFNFKYEENGEKKEVIRTALEVGIHLFDLKENKSEGVITIGHHEENTILPALMDLSSKKVTPTKKQIAKSKKPIYEEAVIPKISNRFNTPTVQWYDGQTISHFGGAKMSK
jgi:single-stranded DNA-binding protein